MLESVRQANSEAIERRVRGAVARLSAAGAPISFYSIAKEACIARSTLYRRPELRQLVEAARQKSSLQARSSAAVDNGNSSDVAMLQQALEAAEAEIARLLALGADRRDVSPSLVYSICPL